ncbi:hypothetical protein K440DRAFT_547241 [Wilcoxina mikolae CBS 423.85]|nr:hypothetical protein K440DRAFT_547241 [Wilcoxina mikolae CBS 423.85]
MPFNLKNSLVIFQAYLNNCLQNCTNDPAICYINNIPTYRTTTIWWIEAELHARCIGKLFSADHLKMGIYTSRPANILMSQNACF